MTTQQLVPLGIIDRPNQYGVIPAGALSTAGNVFLRKPGILTPQPVLNEWDQTAAVSVGFEAALIACTDVPGQSPQWCLQLNSSTSSTIYIWARSSDGAFNSSTWTELTTATVPLLIANRPFWVKHRTRFFILTDRGTMVQDFLNPASSTERRPRYAGMIPVSGQLIQGIATPGGGIYATDTRAAYRSVYRRVFADGYAITSQPFPPAELYAVAAENGQIQINVPSTALVDDIVEVYRTKIVAGTVDPGPTYYLCKSFVVTASQIGTVVTLTDNVPNEGLGLELYTNPGQEGAAQDNRQPPLAKCIAVYKGFTFYANLTQPPRLTFTAPVTANVPATPADKRGGWIGTRQVTGTTTNGNPTITAISAADMIGLVIGQRMSTTGRFAFPATIIAVGANSITLDQNANAGGAGYAFAITDIIYARQGGSGSYSLAATASAEQFLAFDLTNSYVVTTDRLAVDLNNPTPPAPGLKLSIEPARWITTGDGSFEFLATNGQNYTPVIPSPAAFPISTGQAGLKATPKTEKNRFQWSKDQQPEACPAINSAGCGSTDILGLASTRDALYFFCADGLFRLSGSAGQWRLDPVDSTITPAGPKTIGVMFDTVYCYSNNGLARITSSGVPEYLSAPRINALQGQTYDEASTMLLICDEGNNEVWFAFTPQTGGTWWIYNAITDSFVNAIRTSSEAVTAVGYAELGFNSGAGGIEFAGRNTANTFYALKHLDAVPTQFMASADMRFQAAYGKRAETVKQWLRATHMFSPGASGTTFIARWNGTIPGSIAPSFPVSTGPDSRATFWVPSSAAVAASIQPGIRGSTGVGSTNYDYLGCTLEFEELTTQQRAR